MRGGSKTGMVRVNEEKITYIGEKTRQKCLKIINKSLTNFFLRFQSTVCQTSGERKWWWWFEIEINTRQRR